MKLFSLEQLQSSAQEYWVRKKEGIRSYLEKVFPVKMILILSTWEN